MPRQAQDVQASEVRATRNRKSHSCTECRRRKKHCDRNVPGCNQCLLRGTADLCRWGDERDDEGLRRPRSVDRVEDDRGAREQLQVTANGSTNEAFHPYSYNRWPSNDQTLQDDVVNVDDVVHPLAETPSSLRVRELLSKNYDRSALIAELAEADNQLGSRETLLDVRRPSLSSSSTPRQSDVGLHSFGAPSASSYSMTSPGSSTSMSVAPLAPPAFPIHHQHEKSTRSSSSSRAKPLLTLQHAQSLYRHYDELIPDKILVIDDIAIQAALQRSKAEQTCNDLSDIRQRQPDIYALILTVCASTALLLPPSYSITIGLLSRYQDLHTFVAELEDEVERTIRGINEPTLAYVQCGTLYLHNLAQRAGAQTHVERIDRYIRAARRMGLDRLGSPQDDEKVWQRQDAEGVQRHCAHACTSSGRSCAYGLCFETQGSSMTTFAADTLRKRDRRARNMGRTHWRFLTAKDWVAARLSGCYTVHPNSYTSSLPTPYSTPSDDTMTEKMATVWQYCWVGAESSRMYNDLTAEAESQDTPIDYDKILELDNMLVAALDARPEWLRPEEDSRGRKRTRQEQFDGLLVSCTLWHRLFVIHRPFLMLSQTHAERYGGSASRSWDYARLTIKMTREAWQTSSAMIKMLPMHFRLLQAALVLISHLFLWPQEPSLSDTIDIHEDIHFVINTLSTVHKQGSQSIFVGQSERLEALLAATARLKGTQKQGSVHNATLAPWMRPSQVLEQIHVGDRYSYADSILPTQPLPSSSVDANSKTSELLGTLDEQLLRLMGEGGLPMQSQQSDDGLWAEIFSFLDANAMFTPSTVT